MGNWEVRKTKNEWRLYRDLQVKSNVTKLTEFPPVKHHHSKAILGENIQKLQVILDEIWIPVILLFKRFWVCPFRSSAPRVAERINISPVPAKIVQRAASSQTLMLTLMLTLTVILQDFEALVCGTVDGTLLLLWAVIYSIALLYFSEERDSGCNGRNHYSCASVKRKGLGHH